MLSFHTHCKYRNVGWLAWFYFLTSHQGGANGILNDFCKLWGHFNVSRQSPKQQEEHGDLLLKDSDTAGGQPSPTHSYLFTKSYPSVRFLSEGGPYQRQWQCDRAIQVQIQFFSCGWWRPKQFGNLTVTVGGPKISPSHGLELQNKKPRCFPSRYHYIQVHPLHPGTITSHWVSGLPAVAMSRVCMLVDTGSIPCYINMQLWHFY